MLLPPVMSVNQRHFSALASQAWIVCYAAVL
jgi:hypothetical protein